MVDMIRLLDLLVTAIWLCLLVSVALGAEVVPVREVTTDAAAEGVRPVDDPNAADVIRCVR